MDQAGGADFLDDDLFNSLLNDVTPLGLRQSPCQSGAEPGEAFATLKGEGFDDTVAGTVNWFNFDGAALQHAQPLLSSNPLAGHQQPTAGPAEQTSSSSPPTRQLSRHNGTAAAHEDADSPAEFTLHSTHPASGDLDINDPRQRARAAQKRFRTRQKERSRSQQKQVEELTSRLKELMQEKSALQTRNKILETVVVLNTRHEKRLHCNQVDQHQLCLGSVLFQEEIMSMEQGMLMDELSQFVNVLEQRTDLTGADVQQWTMGQYMDHVFPRYIAKCKQLLVQTTEAAKQEVEDLVSLRRELEDRKALFSCYYWALYSWNKEEMGACDATPPPPCRWLSILEGLHLSHRQEEAILTSRKELVERLQEIARERAALLSAVALLVLQKPPEEWQRSGELQRLQSNLGQERTAVHTFLFTLCDEVLTPQQEAFLDASAYPWWPDLWQIAWLLFQQHTQPGTHTPPTAQHTTTKRSTPASGASRAVQMAPDVGQPDDVPDLAINIPVLKSMSLLPHSSAVEVLVQPLLARGGGLRLKCGLVIDPFQTVLPAAAFSVPSIAQLRGMHLLDVHCGRFFPVMFWDWLREHMPNLPELPH